MNVSNNDVDLSLSQVPDKWFFAQETQEAIHNTQLFFSKKKRVMMMMMMFSQEIYIYIFVDRTLARPERNYINTIVSTTKRGLDWREGAIKKENATKWMRVLFALKVARLL